MNQIRRRSPFRWIAHCIHVCFALEKPGSSWAFDCSYCKSMVVMMLHDSRNLHQRKAACSSRVVISSHWRAFEGWQARLSPVPQKQKKDHRQGLPRHTVSAFAAAAKALPLNYVRVWCQHIRFVHGYYCVYLLARLWIQYSVCELKFGWWFLRQCLHKEPLKNYWQIDKERLNSESFAKWSHYSHKKVMKYDKSSEKENMYVFFAANGQFDVFY